MMGVAGGYGIVEWEVFGESRLANVTLRHSGLRDVDILLLGIERGKEFMPNPRADEVILPGDLLFCFGPPENVAKIERLEILGEDIGEIRED